MAWKEAQILHDAFENRFVQVPENTRMSPWHATQKVKLWVPFRGALSLDVDEGKRRTVCVILCCRLVSWTCSICSTRVINAIPTPLPVLADASSTAAIIRFSDAQVFTCCIETALAVSRSVLLPTTITWLQKSMSSMEVWTIANLRNLNHRMRWSPPATSEGAETNLFWWCRTLVNSRQHCEEQKSSPRTKPWDPLKKEGVTVRNLSWPAVS